jgi:uncharacterized protein (DUF885 family)
MGINRAQLSAQDRLNYDLFRRQVEEGLEEFQFKYWMLPVNQRGGIQTVDTLTEVIPFETAKDYADWIARMRAFPTYMDQTIALMRAGMKEGMKYPKVIMQRIPAQIDKQFVEPEQSGFYGPFKKMPDSIPAAEQDSLRAEAKTAIAENVIPSYRKMKEFFVNEYLPASFDQVGAWQWPNGDKAYAFFARKFTTTNMTPEQIHQVGLAEVKRIREEMEKVKAEAGFTGTLNEFFTFLRTDPRFYYKDPQDLLEAYRATAKQIDPQLVKLFGKLPRLTYGVEPIPAITAPDTTAAYYQQGSAEANRAGTYAVNLYKPESRPKWEMMALSLHESVPGHHLQISLGQEMGEMPKFRRYGYYSAFGEGWGLYSEWLGYEMGLYKDPYSKFGQLVYEMWRAVRLVVDTGMHQKKWTRQQAIDYFMENAAKTEQDVVNEIDRYIYWPGQALAYKVGQMKIKELRQHATEELGAKFNVKEFHDMVLGSGAIPLDMLEKNVNEWIAKKKGAAKKQ